MVNVIPQSDVLAENLFAHAVVQTGTFVSHSGSGKIVKKRTDNVQHSRRFENSRIVSWLQIARLARSDRLVAGTFGELVGIDIANVRRVRFGPTRRIIFQNSYREFSVGVLVAGKQFLRIRQNGLVHAA